MKLLSWNVNGIRAILKKGLRDWVISECPDIFCLQETKATPEQVAPESLEDLGYHSIWAVAERKGYSGVATYFRKPPVRSQVGLGISQYDVEGRVVVTWYPSFVLVNVYVPNGQADHQRVPFKMAFCKELLHLLDRLRMDQPHVVICGDFNIAHQPIDVSHAEKYQNTTGFLPVERAWLNQFFTHGYIDIFRKFESGPGHYTWWDYRTAARERNDGWRIDYFCVSQELQPHVISAGIQPHITGSDHCPVSLELQLNSE